MTSNINKIKTYANQVTIPICNFKNTKITLNKSIKN